MADPLFCPAPPYRRGRVLCVPYAYGQVVFNWTLANYTRFFEPLYLTIFASTLVTAFVTTLLTFAMGYPVAYTIAMILPKKWQQAGIILVMIPFWINFLIRSFAWVIICVPRTCQYRSSSTWDSLKAAQTCSIMTQPSFWAWSTPCFLLWCFPSMFPWNRWIKGSWKQPAILVPRPAWPSAR